MVVNILIKRGAYHDSVALMRISRLVKSSGSVRRASVMMASPPNKGVLKESGLFNDLVESANSADLVIAVEAEDEDSAALALQAAEQALAGAGIQPDKQDESVPVRTLNQGLRHCEGANLAFISVPGIYAASEALKALKAGLNVFLFSDNVSLEDEVNLKKEAHQRGLIVMGPDCGTSLIKGVPLGFVNSVRHGCIGIVGASGTGIQEVMSIVERSGSGISHAFGTGSRDLTESVGGITMFDALNILENDSDTKVIVVLSKPPAQPIVDEISKRLSNFSKPSIVYFQGGCDDQKMGPNVHVADTLEHVAALALAIERNEVVPKPERFQTTLPVLKATNDGYLRGLFSGGTLAKEALLIIKSRLDRVVSNLSGENWTTLDYDSNIGHSVIDFGDDQFTVGRPHPMIDLTYRMEQFNRDALNPSVRVLLMDIVLGYGAHPDPSQEFAPVIANALKGAQADGRTLNVVLSIVGTDSDPQRYGIQVEKFSAAGALIAPTTAQAAHMALDLLGV